MMVDGFIKVCSNFFFLSLEWITRDETNVLWNKWEDFEFVELSTFVLDMSFGYKLDVDNRY